MNESSRLARPYREYLLCRDLSQCRYNRGQKKDNEGMNECLESRTLFDSVSRGDECYKKTTETPGIA